MRMQIIRFTLFIVALFFWQLGLPVHAPATEQAGTEQTIAQTQGPGVLIFSPPADQPLEETPAFLPKTIDLSGIVELKTALDTRKSADFEHTRMLRNRIRLESRWTPNIQRAEAATPTNLFFLASVQSDYLWFGPENKTDDYYLELFEGFMHWSRFPWEIRLGRQRVRWGKADGISPVDNLNPHDLREFLLPEIEERKLPNWMARVRHFSDWFTLEGVYIPFFEPPRLDYFGTDWAMFGHIKEVLRQSPLPQDLQARIDHISVTENKPPRRLTTGDWGIRTARTFDGWDVAASYLYAWEKLPHVLNNPLTHLTSDPFHPHLPVLSTERTGSGIDVEYRRSNIFGLEMETTVNGFGLRGEGAYFDRSSFLTRDLVSMDKAVLHYVLGVDYLGERDWYVNLQFGHHVIFGYDQRILYWNRHDYSMNGEISKEFWRGNFEAVIRYYYNFRDKSVMLNPHLVLRYFQNWELTLGLDFFEGSADTFLGQYQNNDQIYCMIRYYF